MINLQRFRRGDPVEGYTFNGLKIIGNYVRISPSFGCIIIGIIEGVVEAPREYHVARLTLKRRKTPPTRPKKPKKQPKNRHFNAGDPVSARTKDGLMIVGEYHSYGPKPYAYIRGVICKNGELAPPSTRLTYKVIRETIQPWT
jgi:hypothetical protein